MEKIKNLPVMRVVAFAVAIAIVIGFSSVMFQVTASAESTNKDIKTGSFTITGKYDGYPCIDLGTELSFYDFVQNYNSFGYGFCVIPIVIKNNVTYYYKSNSSWNCYGYIDVYTATSSNGGTIFYSGVNFYPTSLAGDNGESYKNYKSVIKQASSGDGLVYVRYDYNKSKKEWVLNPTEYSVDFYDYKSNTYATNILPSDIKYVLVSNQSRFLQNKNRNNNWSDLDSIFSDNATFTEAGASPSAEFVTCKSFTREDGGLPLWFKDFTADGLQYPMFTYYISDNGNKHRYQLRLSYSSSQSNVVNTIFGIVNENNLSEQEKTLRELGQFLKGHLPTGSTSYSRFMALKPYMELILKKPEYISFDEAFTLNSNQMNFETSETSGNKVYTICLSDYSDIVANYIYRAQIVDMQTSEILDTTYFCSNKTYHKGDSGTGVKIYDYGDDSDKMLDDIINNTPSVTPGIDNKFSTTGDIIDMQDNDYLSGLKIDNIFSVLGQSAKSVGAFFQACLNIVPSAILSILLSTLSLLIVLRVLGR